ncbi:MAG: protein TolR [Desulfobacteraceae bacterium]|jgi:biopolymer transport protein TolR|nr:protein TolR [Desulfobacteraceae bacterium]MBC2750250.1 protein TolR [Desulfobacteraceae bacterium]
MQVGGKDSGFMGEINVTPFVDVMLVLLIIFMVTAPMMVEGVNVDLPETTAQPLESEKEPLVVTIDKDGQVFINDFKTGRDIFATKLTKVLEARQDRTVYLKADKTIPYGVVMQIMSEIRGTGVAKLGMVTLPVPETPPQ